MSSSTSDFEHRHKRQRLSAPTTSEEQGNSASSRVFGTPELMSIIVDELVPPLVEPPEESEKLDLMRLEEARLLAPLIRLMRVSHACRNAVLASSKCRKALFLTAAIDKQDCQDNWRKSRRNSQPIRQNPLLPKPFQFTDEFARRNLGIHREAVMEWLRGQEWEWAVELPRRRVVPSWVHMQLSYPPVKSIKLVAVEGSELSDMQGTFHHWKAYDHSEPRTYIIKPCPLKESIEACPYGWGMHDCYDSNKGVTLGMLVAALTKWYCYGGPWKTSGGPGLEFANGYLEYEETPSH